MGILKLIALSLIIIALSGCSKDNPANTDYSEHLGCLKITVSGTPDKTTTYIKITGPDTVEFSLDSTLILDSIKTGTYILKADTLFDSLGFKFAAISDSQTVNVIRDDTSSVNIEFHELENYGHLRFITYPDTIAWHSHYYEHQFEATDDSGNQITYDIIGRPPWMIFDATTNTIQGVPEYEHLRSWRITLKANNGLGIVSQSFSINVYFTQVAEGSWYNDTPHEFPHDGSPLEGSNIIVYSDASNLAVKQIVLDYAETALAYVKSELDITDNSEFLFPDGQIKLDVYANRFNESNWNWGGWAYYGGYLIKSWDHIDNMSRDRETWFTRTTRHETTHAVEFLMKGGDIPANKNTWMTEGLATYVTGNPYNGIYTAEDLNNWLLEFGEIAEGGNPISVRQWSDMPPGILEIGSGYYFPMFELAVRYLVDPNGHGKSLTDIKNMWLDIRNGTNFYIAFDENIGMTVEYYQANFFEIMNAYLP